MDKSRFTICRAAAGSGKTYTLVRTYLQLAFSAKEQDLKTRFTRILAITFTNKAANEMKERILRELDNMAEMGTACDMGKDLAERMKLSDAKLRLYAETVRTAILHNYSDFAVCTIDSFMSRLVRTFAHELGLPMQFDLYTDNSDLIQSAVDELMGMAGVEGQEDLTRVMCEFSESKMNDGKGYLIERDLTQLAKELFKESTPEYIAELKTMSPTQFCQAQQQMIAANKAFEKALAQLGQQAMDIIHGEGLDVADFYYGSKGAGDYFYKTSTGVMSNPNRYALDYLEGDKLGGSKTPKEVVAKLEGVKPRLQEMHRQIGELKEREGVKYNSRKLLLKNLYSLALINKLNELVGQFSAENEIVHISEFNKRIAQVVQNEPTPFIYERIGNRYWNYLIDEFQDTSRMQWQNLVPLVENGVGSGHESLVVGDGKQAIYRFRQGDVDQFVSLPQVDNPVHGRLLESDGTSHLDKLERNFRSATQIVEFNNHFFEWAVKNRFAENKELQQIYIGAGEKADLAQEPNKKKEGGYVQVGCWDDDLETLWDEMYRDIEQLVKEKGYEYRDMAILARNNKTLSDISTYLTAKGIPVVSSESFLLTQSRVVMTIYSLLQYLLDGSNKVAAARVLQYLDQLGKIQVSMTDSFLNHPEQIDLEEILRLEGISINCNKLRQLGLYDCCEEALRRLGLNGIETSYAATLLNVAAKYESRHRQDLGEFIEWFDKQKDKLSTCTSSDLNAISLMTIHKAKGLEAPIVLYPVPASRPQSDNFWVHIKDDQDIPLPASLISQNKNDHTIFDPEYQMECTMTEMDRMNVLYVALTRPKEKLMIYCKMGKNSAETTYERMLHDYMEQLEEKHEVRDNVVALGENTPKQQKKDSTGDAKNVELGEALYPDWSNRISIAEQSAKTFGELDEEHIRRGNEMHELLALIKSIDDTDSALDTYFKRNRLEDSEKELLTTMLSKMMEQPEVAKFFSPEHECKNEASLIWHGNVLRPDRVVLTEDETWVVDFKTGMPDIQHHDQVQTYCNALADMGLPTPRGFLLYIGEDHCQVVEV